MKKAHGGFFGRPYAARRLILLGLAVLLCAVISLQMRHGDYYAQTGLQDRLLPTDAMTAYLEKNPSYTANNVALGETSFDGERYASDEFVLFDAAYHLTINYRYEGEGDAALLLKDLNLLAEDNTASAAFFSQPLSPGVDTQLVVPLQLDATRNAVKAVLSVPRGGALTVNNLQLQTVRPYFTDSLLTTLFAALAAAALWWLCTCARNGSGRYGWVTTACICFLLAAAASLPYYQQGLPFGHDSGYHVVRVEALQASLASGNIFAHTNPYVFRGYGSADFIYYPNLLLYFPALLRMLHVSMLLTYKAMFFSVHFVTALFAYTAAYKICGKRSPALFFASLYTFGLYRLMNVYTRGAVGEVLAMAFLPLVLYGIHSIFHEKKPVWVALAFGMFGIVGSHVISVFLVGLLLAVYCAVQWKQLLQKRVFVPLCKAAGVCLGLCMTWLLPFLIWMQYPTNTQYNRMNDLTSLAAQPVQMFATFAFSPSGTSLNQLQGVAGEMPLSIGILPGVGVLLYLFVRYCLRNPFFETNKSVGILGNTCLAGFCICFFAATPLFPYSLLSKLGSLNFLSTIQFPWRFLSMATLFASALTAIGVCVLLPRLSAQTRLLAAFALILLPFVFCLPYLDSYSNTVSNALTSTNATLVNPEGDLMYMMQPAVQKTNAFPTITGGDAGLKLSACGREPLKVWFSFENPTGKAQAVRVPLYSFPNARAVLADGTQLETQTGSASELLVTLPEGVESGTVTADFALPWYFHLGDMVSLLTWLGLGAWSIRAAMRRRTFLPENAPSA